MKNLWVMAVSMAGFAFGHENPFAGIALDEAVWQWSTDLPAVTSEENHLPPRAFLYIPPTTRNLRGVVVGQFNMLERPILESPVFRKWLAKLDYGAIWIAPSLFGNAFDFHQAKQAAAMQSVFDRLAAVSGYTELTNAPFAGLGHSAMAALPFHLAAWQPDRAIAAISYDGSVPNVDYPYQYHTDPVLDGETMKRLIGIPLLSRDGEYSGGRDNRRAAVLLKEEPLMCHTLLSEPGSGHFGWTEAGLEMLGEFLAAADRARSVGHGSTLRPVTRASGWCLDNWQYNHPPRAAAAPATAYQPIPGRHGPEANWAFDAAFAARLAAFQSRFDPKGVALLGYVQNGSLLPDLKDHLQIHPRFLPEADGISFRLKGVFIKQVTEGRAPRWCGKKAGEAIPPGTHPEEITLRPICGPVVKTGPDRFSVRFDRFGFTSSRRTGEIYLLMSWPGDETHRPIELQSTLRVPVMNHDGKKQKITFPKIEDVQEGTQKIVLRATCDSGRPITYFVTHGPAYIQDDLLFLTPLPPRAKRPVEVRVTASQYGSSNEPKIASATPVERRFFILEPPKKNKN